VRGEVPGDDCLVLSFFPLSLFFPPREGRGRKNPFLLALARALGIDADPSRLFRPFPPLFPPVSRHPRRPPSCPSNVVFHLFSPLSICPPPFLFEFFFRAARRQDSFSLISLLDPSKRAASIWRISVFLFPPMELELIALGDGSRN